MLAPDPIQTSLLDERPYNPKPPETIQERFERYHREHPEVYRLLVNLARQAHARGKRVGIKCLFEIVRWNFWIRRGDEGFVLNNDFTSRYGRLIMQREFDLRDYFETRELKA